MSVTRFNLEAVILRRLPRMHRILEAISGHQAYDRLSGFKQFHLESLEERCISRGTGWL